MFVRLLALLIVASLVCLGHVAASRRVGGWQPSSNSELQAEMLDLANEQLSTSTDFDSPTIDVVSFETQIVAGTNLRLVFLVNEALRCTLTAFKPLPYTQKPIEVSSFACDATPEDEH